MSSIDSAINVTYNVIVSPIKLGVWAWKKVRPSKEVVVHDDSCPRLSELPLVADTSKIDAAWPPAPHPVEALSVHDMFVANTTLIRELCYAARLSEDELHRFLLPVITNLAMIVHLAPASEYDHHQGYGGLFTHSLEVAYFAANEADSTIFDRSAPPKVLHQNKRRWILTAILAALSHDIGKVFTDMTITAPDGRHWTPDVPLLTWLRRNKIEEYFISFRLGREHNAHKDASLHKSTMLIPTETYRFLNMGGLGEVFETEFRNALLYGKEGGLIGRILDNADGKSRREDQRRQRKIRPEFKNVSHPQANQLLKAIRVLVKHEIWTTNIDAKSRVFNTKQGCFIAWSAETISEARNQASSEGDVSLPSDLIRMASILVDAGVAVQNSEEVSNTQNPFWCVTPIVLGTTQVNCIKLADPNFIFDAVPPAKIEAIVEGLAIDEETRNAWIKRWKFMPIQRITRNEEVEMGYTEAFIDSLAKDAEEHLREAEELERSINNYNCVANSGVWVPHEHPTAQDNTASYCETENRAIGSQNDKDDQQISSEDFAGAMADLDDEELTSPDVTDDLEQDPQSSTGTIVISQNSDSDTESQKPIIAMKRKPTGTASTQSKKQAELDMSIVLPDSDVETRASSPRQSQIPNQKKKEASTEFNMSALLGEDPDDEVNDVDESSHRAPITKNQASEKQEVSSIQLDSDFEDKKQTGQITVDMTGSGMDWGTYADIDGNAPFDDDMVESSLSWLQPANQNTSVELAGRDVRVQDVRNKVPQNQKSLVDIPIGFVNVPADQVVNNGSNPTTKKDISSTNTILGHFETDDYKKVKQGRGRPSKRSEADRQYEEAELLVKDMTTQMEQGEGSFIMDALTLDYTSGLLGTPSKEFEQAMRELGIDEFLVEMILEKKAISDERPRIEWNRKDGKVLYVR